MKKVTIATIIILISFVVCIGHIFYFRQLHPDSISLSNEISSTFDNAPKTSMNEYGKFNINTATDSELCTIPGIGTTLANRIVEYRNINGPYKSVEELLNVRGIGEKTLNSILDYVCVE